MPAVDIALVGRVDDLARRTRQVYVLHFEVPRSEQLRLATGGRDRVQVRPTVAFPGENNPVALGPQQLVAGGDRPEDAAASGTRPPDLASLPGRSVGDANRPGLARTQR